MKLKELCILKSGYQGKTQEGDMYKQIRLKDVSREGTIYYDQLESFNAVKMNAKYFLKKGDILFKAKSGDNTAALVDSDVKHVVATAHFITLEIIDQNMINPEYLVMYLNSEYGQEYFKKYSEGSVLNIIKAKVLEDLEVTVLPMEEQVELVAVYNAMKEERRLMEEVMRKREDQFKGFLREKLEGEGK